MFVLSAENVRCNSLPFVFFAYHVEHVFEQHVNPFLWLVHSMPLYK